jgi:hypothetical protein
METAGRETERVIANTGNEIKCEKYIMEMPFAFRMLPTQQQTPGSHFNIVVFESLNPTSCACPQSLQQSPQLLPL